MTIFISKSHNMIIKSSTTSNIQSLICSKVNNHQTSFSPFTCSLINQFVRHASKKTGGSSKNGRKAYGKRLGLKTPVGTHVSIGNIIMRQRGFKFWPGEGVSVGRDHTIVALKDGKVHIHYDVETQRRYISVDDGSMPVKNVYPSRGIVKENLTNRIDAQLYLSLDKFGRYNYVCEKIQEMKAEQEKTKQEYLLHRVTNNSRDYRKFNLVDLTLI